MTLFLYFAATFLKEVSGKSQSFNMLVFHQNSIVESLKTHLSVKDSLAYQPILEWVGFILFVCSLCLSVTHISAFQLPVDVIAPLTPVSNVSFVLQPGGATCQRPADGLLPTLPWFLYFDYFAAGHQGHGAAGMGVHLSLIPLQVPVAAHGERHEQYLQVTIQRLKLSFTGKLKIMLNFFPTVYTACFWHTRRSTSASLQQRVFLFWCERWETTNVKVHRCLPFSHLKDNRAPPYVLQVSDIDALLGHMFTDLEQHPEKAAGAGQLLFEMCKGVRHMFHSCAANVS